MSHRYLYGSLPAALEGADLFGTGLLPTDFTAALATTAGLAAALAFTAGAGLSAGTDLSVVAGLSTGAGLSTDTDLVGEVAFLPCAAATLCESRPAFIACDKDEPDLPDSAAGSLDAASFRESAVGVAAGTSAGRGGGAGVLAWLGSDLFDESRSAGP